MPWDAGGRRKLLPATMTDLSPMEFKSGSQPGHCRSEVASLPHMGPSRGVRAMTTTGADMSSGVGFQSLPTSPVRRQSAPGSPDSVRPPKSAFYGERSAHGGSALGKKSYSRMPSGDGGGIGRPSPPPVNYVDGVKPKLCKDSSNPFGARTGDAT
jgi:hypothetical protein